MKAYNRSCIVIDTLVADSMSEEEHAYIHSSGFPYWVRRVYVSHFLLETRHEVIMRKGGNREGVLHGGG